MPQPYKLRTNSPGVIRLEDNTVIVPDVGSFNWQTYLAWMYAGNEPDPADPPVMLPRRLPKATIVDRLTDEELEAFKTLKPTLPARLIFLWDEAHNNEVNPDDPRLVEAFTAILGVERTAEVLA